MKHFSLSKWSRLFLILLSALFLTGCSQKALYTGLKEKDANEIVSILQRQGIGSEKRSGLENTWETWVDDSSFSKAVSILNEAGYPKDKFSTLGDVFKKTGLVSSPLEERIRFMYALSENLSETISHIEGVSTARVHIVLPENDPYSDKKLPSSASVFISYLPNANIDESVREIKNLVANSIEGLQYDKISVALFPASLKHNQHFSANQTPFKKVLFFDLAPHSVGLFWTFLSLLTLLLTTLIGAVGFLLWKFYFNAKQKPSTPSASTV